MKFIVNGFKAISTGSNYKLEEYLIGCRISKPFLVPKLFSGAIVYAAPIFKSKLDVR
jgi:hypothetical protein